MGSTCEISNLSRRLVTPNGSIEMVVKSRGNFPPKNPFLGGGNSNISYFHPEKWGRFPILTNIFQRGWNHQLVFNSGLGIVRIQSFQCSNNFQEFLNAHPNRSIKTPRIISPGLEFSLVGFQIANPLKSTKNTSKISTFLLGTQIFLNWSLPQKKTCSSLDIPAWGAKSLLCSNVAHLGNFVAAACHDKKPRGVPDWKKELQVSNEKNTWVV